MASWNGVRIFPKEQELRSAQRYGPSPEVLQRFEQVVDAVHRIIDQEQVDLAGVELLHRETVAPDAPEFLWKEACMHLCELAAIDPRALACVESMLQDWRQAIRLHGAGSRYARLPASIHARCLDKLAKTRDPELMPMLEAFRIDRFVKDHRRTLAPPRKLKAVLEDIRGYDPGADDDFTRLADLVDELEGRKVSQNTVKVFLALWERFPASDGEGVFDTMGLLCENTKAAPALVQRSFNRRPSQGALAFLQACLEPEEMAGLLEKALERNDLPAQLRFDCQDLLSVIREG